MTERRWLPPFVASQNPEELSRRVKAFVWARLGRPDDSRNPLLRPRLQPPMGTSLATSRAAAIALSAPIIYLRIGKVRELTGLATSTLYRLMKHGMFPRPVKLGPNCVGWREDHIVAWCSERKPRNHKPP